MQTDYLWQKLGPIVQAGLKNDDVVEIMLNDDGKIWFAYKSQQKQVCGVLPAKLAIPFAYALAQYRQQFLSAERPYLDTTLPFNNERINITVPPVSKNIAFNIRKHSKTIFSLTNYVQQNIITTKQKTVLEQAIIANKNILISGGAGSGKTTFVNALLHSMSQLIDKNSRVIILEQVQELQCSLKNVKHMQSSYNISLNKLLWLAMRNTPNKIIIGEVRDGAALTMLKAFNTGCQGGIATIHANSAKLTMHRVLSLAQEANNGNYAALAAASIDIIVHLAVIKEQRQISAILQVQKFDNDKQEFIYQKLA